MKVILNIFLAIFFAIPFGIAQDQHVVDSLEDILSRGGHSDSALFSLYIELAWAHSEPQAILETAEQAKAMAVSLNRPDWEARANLYRGDGYRLKGDLTRSIESYLETAAYASSAGDNINLAAAYNNIGNLYSIQENFPNAIKYFRRCIEVYSSERDSSRLANILLNLGEVFRMKGDADSAVVYFNKSNEIALLLDLKLTKAYALGNLGLVFAEREEYQQAEQHIDDAIVILKAMGDYYPIVVYQTYMADIYQNKGQFSRALKLATESYNIAIAQGLKEQIRDAGKKLSELYEATNDYKNAYFYQSQYITYRDSLKNEETIMKMADLRTEFEVSKKQNEVDLLNQETKNQRILLISLGIILVLLLGLTYVLFKIYKLRIKAHKILAKRKEVIESQRNQLDALNRTKDRFFSIVSHDLRGPVSSFQGVSELLKEMVREKEFEELESTTVKLEKSARQLSLLLDNLLGWALGQQGQFPYRPEKLALSDVFDSTLSILENMAASKKQNLTYSARGKLKIWADRDSTLAIFRNLIGNALKFTPEGGDIEFTARKQGDMALLTVKDSGVGISKEKLSGIFNFEGNKSSWGTRGEKGMGLGLILVHEFVEMNKGRIEVMSKEGQGTKVNVWLPLYVEKTEFVNA